MTFSPPPECAPAVAALLAERPVKIGAVVSALGAAAFQSELWDPSRAGVLDQSGAAWRLRANKADFRPRQRLTLATLAVHLVMHRPLIEMRGGMLILNSNHASGLPPDLDREARWAALDLLMPDEAFIADLDACEFPISDAAADDLARKWEVPPQALETKFWLLGVHREK